MNTCIAIIVSIIVGSILSARGQIIYAPSAYNNNPASLAHQAVVLNAQMEDQLPEELHRSNKFYSNPIIAQGLARESWLTDKESPVFQRAAEKIPRSEIYKLVKSAGFIHRR